MVVGLKNKKLSEKLQLDPELTLEKAMPQARQSEEVKKQSIIPGRNTPDVMSTITLTISLRIENNTRVTHASRQTQMFAVFRTSEFQAILPSK